MKRISGPSYGISLLVFLLFSTILSAVCFPEAQAGTSTGQVCALDSTCGTAATRGNGAKTTTSGCAATSGEYCGAQASPGYNAVPVYAWDHCRYITNKLSSAIFVPFGNTVDWLAFINNVDQVNVAGLQDCSLPTTFRISADQSCTSASFIPSTYSTTPIVTLGYAPVATTQTVAAQYLCTGSNGKSWTEYEVVTYTGLDAEKVSPSWSAGTPVCSLVQPGTASYPVACRAPADTPSITLIPSTNTVTLGASLTLTWTVTNATSCTASSSDLEADWNGSKAYSGTTSQIIKPTLTPTTTYTLSCVGPGGTDQTSVTIGTTIVGLCGTANNVAVSGAPSSGLCGAGKASPVSGTGPWTWTCAGSTAATTASCAAPAIGAPTWGDCSLTNPILGSFSADGSYSISGTGSSYSVVGSNGSVAISGFNHGANISGDEDTIAISGSGNCVSLSGSSEKITVSGTAQKVNLSGSNVTINISGANDNITLNILSGSNVALAISGLQNSITINGDGYTISSLSGIGNIINGVPVN